MRNLFTAVAVVAAVSLSPLPLQAGILGLFGFDCGGPHNCSCGSHCGCGNCCEPACGCGCNDCCEPACGCESCSEPCCGCGTGCYANGCQYAGQCFHCGCNSYVPWCPCRPCDGGCCQNGCGGCGNCCEPTCGCDSCCEPCCGCGTGCPSWYGTGTANCPRKCCLKNCGFCRPCWGLVDVFHCLCPCNGCGGEVYWSEWHNDPPYCHDPCNNCGEWIGPSCGCNGCGNGGCCNGGYTQYRPTNNGAAYARQGTANRTQQVATTRSSQQYQNQPRRSYAAQRQMPAAQARTASRPANNSGRSSNNLQPRPILW